MRFSSNLCLLPLRNSWCFWFDNTFSSIRRHLREGKIETHYMGIPANLAGRQETHSQTLTGVSTTAFSSQAHFGNSHRLCQSHTLHSTCARWHGSMLTCRLSIGSPSLRTIWMHSAASSFCSTIRFFRTAISSFPYFSASAATFRKTPCAARRATSVSANQS